MNVFIFTVGGFGIGLKENMNSVGGVGGEVTNWNKGKVDDFLTNFDDDEGHNFAAGKVLAEAGAADADATWGCSDFSDTFADDETENLTSSSSASQYNFSPG